jgi:Tol biopolymer transport system component
MPLRPAAVLIALASAAVLSTGCKSEEVLAPVARAVPHRLLFVSAREQTGVGPWDALQKDIFRSYANGGDVDNLTRAPSLVYRSLSLSPDRQRVAYYTARNGCTEIVTIRVDGSGLRRLGTGDPAVDGCRVTPRWSPDGAHLAFTVIHDGGASVHVMAADGSGARRLSGALPSAATVAEYPVTWTPDGALVFRRTVDGVSRDLVVALDGDAPRPFFDRPEDSSPVWSPDGMRIAFIRRTDGGRASLWVKAADGGWERRLTDQAGNDELRLVAPLEENDHAAWSPDGEWIAFTNTTNAASVHVIRADGTAHRRLTDIDRPSVFNGWSPDGRVTVSAEVDGVSDIYVYRPDGSSRVNLTRVAGHDRWALWVPVN